MIDAAEMILEIVQTCTVDFAGDVCEMQRLHPQTMEGSTTEALIGRRRGE